MSEHVDRFSYIQKRTKPIGKKEEEYRAFDKT